MTRVKRGTISKKRKKKWFKLAKGYKWSRKNRFKLVKEAVQRALVYSYRDRKKKKSNFRRLWQIRIGNATRQYGNIPYNKFIYGLKKANVVLDRKILSDLAVNHPEVFKEIVNIAKQNLG